MPSVDVVLRLDSPEAGTSLADRCRATALNLDLADSRDGSARPLKAHVFGPTSMVEADITSLYSDLDHEVVTSLYDPGD